MQSKRLLNNSRLTCYKRRASTRTCLQLFATSLIARIRRKAKSTQKCKQTERNKYLVLKA